MYFVNLESWLDSNRVRANPIVPTRFVLTRVPISIYTLFFAKL